MKQNWQENVHIEYKI